MDFMSDEFIQSIVDKYAISIKENCALLVDHNEALLPNCTSRYATAFFDETGIKYQLIKPEVDVTCCLRLNDPLVGHFLHFYQKEFHVFLDHHLQVPLNPKVVFWYFMMLKVERGLIPIQVLYQIFGTLKPKMISNLRNCYEVRQLENGRLMAKGDMTYCQTSIRESGSAILGVTHYIIMAYVDHNDFVRKLTPNL